MYAVIHTHTYPYLYVYTRTRACKRQHLSAYMYTHLKTYTRPYTHICTYKHIHIHPPSYICTYMEKHTPIHTYTYTCIYVHPYTHHGRSWPSCLRIFLESKVNAYPSFYVSLHLSYSFSSFHFFSYWISFLRFPTLYFLYLIGLSWVMSYPILF